MSTLIKFKNNGIILLLSLFIMGCSTMNMVSSVEEQGNENLPFRYYDSDSKIAYVVTNDQTNIHLKLRIKEEATIVQVLKSGLTIYLDPLGKKKQTIGLKYPMGQQQMEGQRMDRNKNNSGLEDKNKKLRTLLALTPTSGSYTDNGIVENFSIKDPSVKFKFTLNINDNDELIYDVLIPIHKISENGIQGLANLSIGIEAEAMQMREKPSGDMQGSGGGGGQGGPPGGGGGGGGGQGGPPGGGGQSGPPGGGGSSATSEKIDFWFKVALFGVVDTNSK